MSKKKLLIVILVLLAGGLSYLKVQANNEPARQKITIVGSTALQPLAQQVALEFQKEYKGAQVNVQGGGSGTGLSQIQEKTVDIGNSDIFAENKEGIDAKKLTDHKVAVVGLAPVLNKDIGLKNLTSKQLADIFTGKITNWKEIGGPDLKITVINRAQGSGSRQTFEEAVLNGKKAVNAQEQDSNGTVRKIVANTPGAISYLAFGYINDELQAANIDGVAPTAKNVATNKWKIWSYEHMYTNGKLNKVTKAYLDYILSDEVQNGTLRDAGYVSTKQMKVYKDKDGNVHAKKS